MISPEQLHAALKYHFGFDKFKGDQQQIIESLLNGDDVFVLMPTGGGKSLCYQLPALMSEGTAIVISPLIALMKNQVDSIRHFGEDDGVAHFLNSSLSRKEAENVREDVRTGKTKLLYVAPESLTKEENIEFLKSVNISFFAIDEAHCISEWGHDFRPEYRRIRPMISAIGDFPVIALTATATPKVQHDIQKNLDIMNSKVFKSSFNRSNLYYEVRPKTKEIDKEIIRFIKSNPRQSGIIYCLSRKSVEDLAETLCINGISALPYHAGMDAATRTGNQDAFLLEKVDIIVATIAFGMGIDKPDVRFVIHYDIPKSLEGYYQETGRAGRDGMGGRCIAYFCEKDVQKLDKLMQSKSANEYEISRQLLNEITNYAQSSVCRRKILLHYFGETFGEENCGCCDNCNNPRKRIDASEELLAVLQAVLESGQCHKQEYMTNLLIGRKTDELRSNGDHKLECFGTLDDRDEKFVSTLMRQAVICGYLTRDLENYGILKITEQGKQFLEHPGKFQVVEDVDYSETDTDVQIKGGAACVADPELYAILKAMRKEMARKHGLPPYVIFQDPALEAMSTSYPVTLDELMAIPGVGSGKAHRYGQQYVDVIKKYVDEKEIIRPDDIRVRFMPKRNNMKVAIIHAIDRKIDLHEIADDKGLEFDEFITELENIVEAGTKLDIDYFIEGEIDEDLEADIMLLLRNNEEDNLDLILKEVGDQVDEEIVRLVRVKFISENGN